MLAAKRVGHFAGEPAEGTLRRVHDVPTLLDLAFLDSMGLHEHRKSPAPKALQSKVSRGRKKDIYNKSRQPRQGADADYLSGRRKTMRRPPSGPGRPQWAFFRTTTARFSRLAQSASPDPGVHQTRSIWTVWSLIQNGLHW